MKIFDPKLTGSIAFENAVQGNIEITGDLVVPGSITAREFKTEFVSASIIYQSGSTQFGNSADDTHIFTGSMSVDGDTTATSFIKSGGTSSEFLKADGSVDSNTYLTSESDTLQSVVSRGSTVANTITIDGGNFEIFNASFTDRRITFNQSSGPIPRIYNYDQVGQSFHAIKIGGGNNDTSGLLIGDGSDPTVTIFNPFSINSGTNYNDKGYIYLSNQRSAIISDIVNLTANGDTSLDFQTRSGGTTSSSMFIDEFKRVGIGITSPQTILHLTGAITISDVGDGDNTTLIQLTESNNYDQFAIKGDFAGAGGENKLKFTTDLGGGDILTMKGDGKVGIGENSPSEKLHVGANARVDGNILVGGSSSIRHPALDRFVTVQSTTDGAVIGYNLYVQDGVNNRRGSFFMDDANGVYGIDHTFGSGNLGFVIRQAGSEILRAQDGMVGIGTTDPSAVLDVVSTSAKIAEFERQGSANYDLTVSDLGAGAAQLWFNANTNDTGFLFRPKDSDGTIRNTLIVAPNGDVGIGTTGPAVPLDVRGVTQIRTPMSTAGSLLGNQLLINTTNTVNDTGWQGIGFFTSTTAGYGWSFGANRSSNGRGSMKFYYHNNSDAGTNTFTILEGGGVTFNGDTAAANALDDYEEGTFTPTVNSGTASVDWAKYTKIGDLVFIVCQLQLTGTRTATTFEVSGLPFNNGAQWTPCSFYAQYYNDEGTQQATGVFRASTNIFRVHEFGGEALATKFENGYFAFAGTYKVS